jgi:hypothetical protein
MSPTKLFSLFMMVLLLATAGRSESKRTAFTFENAFPRWEQFEFGVTHQGVEQEDGFLKTDIQTTSAYLRYGVLENFAIQLELPYVNLNPDFGKSESGYGDMELEFQLRTWEDIFGYPYFIPHVNVTLPTGDEDKGLGQDDSTVEVGISYGDKLSDSLMWILDVSYRVNPDIENQFLVGHSYILDLSERFAIIAELAFEEEVEATTNSILLAGGGFSYNWTNRLQMGAHVFGGLSGPTDVVSQFRLSYSF